jgi:hypothetical protein
MGIEIVVAVAIMSGGFVAARAFHFKRMNQADNARRERKELQRRKNHFRGSLDLELDQGPSRPPATTEIDDSQAS